MNTLKSFFAMLVTTVLTVQSLHGQTYNKDVTITAIGSGLTIEDAKQAALRSATEQAFGAFISSKTEMFNDQVVADQMASVSSDNIKSYEVLNESQLPDGSWGVTLNAIVSVDKLTSFVEAKGIEIEIKGGMFALNIKQQLLNEQAEIKAVAEMVGLLHEPMQIAFDYVIEIHDPQSLDSESKNWEIPIVVTASANKNMDFCANYFIKTLSALSLSSEEVESYQSLNKPIFPVAINYYNDFYIFYLRKQSSINVLNTLGNQWEFYSRLFTVQTGMDELNGGDLPIDFDAYGRSYDESYDGRKWSDYLFMQKINHDALNQILVVNIDSAHIRNQNEFAYHYFDFLAAGKKAATFSWNDNRTLSQIEKMTGYTVKPRGIISHFKHGGFVFFEEDGHGLVAAITEFPKINWQSAKEACDELIINGYSDWYLPSAYELTALYDYWWEFGAGGFYDKNYHSPSELWSSSTISDYENYQMITYLFKYETDIYDKYRTTRQGGKKSQYINDEREPKNCRCIRAF